MLCWNSLVQPQNAVCHKHRQHSLKTASSSKEELINTYRCHLHRVSQIINLKGHLLHHEGARGIASVPRAGRSYDMLIASTAKPYVESHLRTAVFIAPP
jgi:hypothetical protein